MPCLPIVRLTFKQIIYLEIILMGLIYIMLLKGIIWAKLRFGHYFRFESMMINFVLR
jgi:hypothetical protein